MLVNWLAKYHVGKFLGNGKTYLGNILDIKIFLHDLFYNI